MDTWTGGTSLWDGAAERIDSPGEYKSASSRAPACCGPHLAEPRPGPFGSGLCVSTPQPFSFTILAISPLWAQPLQRLCTHSREPTESSTFSAHRQRSVFSQSGERRWAQQPIIRRESVTNTADWPMGLASGERPHFLTPPVLPGARCAVSPLLDVQQMEL